MSLFFENFWVQYHEPSKPGNLLAIVRTIVGSDEVAQQIIEKTKSEEVKKTLTENTNKAFNDGAFGLPWFMATNTKGETEGFWGVDHLGQLCDFLGLGRPSGTEWRALL